MRKSQNFFYTVKSTLSLLLAWALLQLVEGALLQAGAWLSGFNGHMVWQDFAFRVPVQQRGFEQSFFLSLFPWLVFLLWALLFPVRFSPAKKKREFFRLLKGWIFLLVLVRALWIPLWEIIYQKGLYDAFERFHLFRNDEYLIGIALFLGLLLAVFRVSTLFAGSLPVPADRFLKSSDIRPHLLYLWAIPAIVFLILLIGISGLKTGFFNGYLAGGIAVVLLVNIPYISNYNVIVK